MCGIAGLIGGERIQAERMSALLSHRGPDGDGIWADELDRAFFAHRRLAIVDLVAGKQPMVSRDGRFVLVFNGEIYNHAFLRKVLEEQGAVFDTHSDTEVILQGFIQEGKAFVHKLTGMFAFAIWDTREKSLFVARDRLGIKPFFFRAKGSLFAFASETKALVSLVDSPQVDTEVLARYLGFGFRVDQRTLFSGIQELPPAHWGAWKAETGFVQEKYWSIPAEDEHPPSLEAAAERLHDLLTETVHSHLMSDVPVGFLLSGGLDSSIVLQAAHASLKEDSRLAFTGGYGLKDDEFPFAKIMAERTGVQWHPKVFSWQQVASSFAHLAWHLEEPLPHVGSFTTYLLSEYVKPETSVVLIGEGADELFAGYPHYLPYVGAWDLLPGRLKGFLMQRAYFMPPRAGWRRLVGPRLHSAFQGAPWPRVIGGSLSQVLRFDLQHQMVQSQLARIDRLTMAHGVEARVPFLDHQVVEMAMRLPSTYKRTREETKKILRRAFASELPREILHRPKFGKKGTQRITASLYERVIGPVAEGLLTERRVDELGYFSGRSVRRLLNMHPPGSVAASLQQKTVFFLLMFDLWHRLFIEKQTREELQHLILQNTSYVLR